LKDFTVKQSKVFLPHKPKVVALVCMGPSIMDYFGATLTQEMTLNFADEIWALNMAANTIEHDVVFWMDDLNQQNNFRSGLIDLLRKRATKYNKPVVTCKRYPELVPLSYDYPIDEIAEFSVPIFGKPYLNNGVAMAVAYAIWLGVKCLKIYGADFTYPNRSFAEGGRACLEAWITIASIRGMEVQLAPNTSLMDNVSDHGVYGFAEQPAMMIGGQMFKYIAASATGGATGPGKYRGGEVIYDHTGAIVNRLGYHAEDSSGVQNGHANVQADVPGNRGSDHAAHLNGAAEPSQVAPGDAAPAAAF
jgi:hypothetical protein